MKDKEIDLEICIQIDKWLHLFLRNRTWLTLYEYGRSIAPVFLSIQKSKVKRAAMQYFASLMKKFNK